MLTSNIKNSKIKEIKKEILVKLANLFNKIQVLESKKITSLILYEVYSIEKSKIHGKGVFATKDFQPGEFINIAAICKGDTSSNLAFLITKFGRYINHSYKPNSELKFYEDIYRMYATKHIKKGEEMTVDYTKTKEFKQPKSWWK
ncbi:MAG: SET domain-containing protein [Candidatus Thorarchaeota archaeon]|jgi:SET domain-containing protein